MKRMIRLGNKPVPTERYLACRIADITNLSAMEARKDEVEEYYSNNKISWADRCKLIEYAEHRERAMIAKQKAKEMGLRTHPCPSQEGINTVEFCHSELITEVKNG